MISPGQPLTMAARSISSRQTAGPSSYSLSSSLTRSPGSLLSPRSGYSFSSGYCSTASGFNFSSYISSSASSYSSLATTAPVILRRKTSGLSRQEYKTRSKSVDASQIYEAAGEDRHKTPSSLERSRASSVVPDPELGENIEEAVRTKPVRNRQSHGVSQYDLERAATWAMIGSNKSQAGGEETERSQESTGPVISDSCQIDYKKVSLYCCKYNKYL